MPDEPIRFRCYRCGKLLGVAARRSGSVVACPQCRAEIQVPQSSGDLEEPEPMPPITIMPPEEVAVEPEIAAIIGAVTAAPPSPIPPILIDSPPNRSSEPQSHRAPDVILPPAVVIAWSLLVLMAVPIAFLAGLLIGRFLWK